MADTDSEGSTCGTEIKAGRRAESSLANCGMLLFCATVVLQFNVFQQDARSGP